MIEEEFAKSLVGSMQRGLKMAKTAKKENIDKFDNAEGIRIIDKMMSSLYHEMGENADIEVKEFRRYSYKLLLAYNRKEHTLYSFMSADRLSNLLSSKNIKDKQNYIFGLMKFNKDDRQQQTLISEIEPITDENRKVQDRIREIIEEDDEIQYITIVYKKQGYNLFNVQAVKLSQYAEIVDKIDLSEYITVDYENLYEEDAGNQVDIPGELEFNIKPEILTKSNLMDVELENKNINRGEINEKL